MADIITKEEEEEEEFKLIKPKTACAFLHEMRNNNSLLDNDDNDKTQDWYFANKIYYLITVFFCILSDLHNKNTNNLKMSMQDAVDILMPTIHALESVKDSQISIILNSFECFHCDINHKTYLREFFINLCAKGNNEYKKVIAQNVIDELNDLLLCYE